MDWVLTGSTVLTIYGGKLVPNDVDVTPALSSGNLERLAAVLGDIKAVPAFVPTWSKGLSLEACKEWTPIPATEQNLDHLFVTRLGMVDVPPRLCGEYDQLIEQAVRIDIGGVPVMVCAVEEVLGRLRGRRRPKDVERAAVYEEVERSAVAGAAPTGVPWLLARLSEAAPA